MNLVCKEINEYIKANSQVITEFLNSKMGGQASPIFTSVDIRNAGFKVAPVDTNLFPAGFNNLSLDGQKLLAFKLSAYLKANFPKVVKILIFPENITRNTNYLESLQVLLSVFQKAGFDTKIDSSLEAWRPDLIVLNNDLTGGLPEELKDCGIPIIPDINLGWHLRRKHRHFASYNRLIREFCALNNFDPWLLSTEFENCEGVDFRNRIGLPCLAQSVDNVLERIKEKYEQYGIKEEPFVFVKADQGTYGMGLMVARSGKEMLDINKKNRHSMQSLKQGVQNATIVVQEGVPTIERYGNASSESLVYLCGADPIETFTRSHEKKGPYASLNSPGMCFSLQEDELQPLKNLVAQVASKATKYELDFV